MPLLKYCVVTSDHFAALRLTPCGLTDRGSADGRENPSATPPKLPCHTLPDFGKAPPGQLPRLVRRPSVGSVCRPPHAVQVELRGVQTHVPEALLQNRARIRFRFDRAKVASERATLCADSLKLLRVRNKGLDLPPVP